MVIWTHDHAAAAGRPEWMTFRPLAVLFLVWAVLIGAALAQDLAGWEGDARVWLLDVDVERSFYTWFSTLLLAGAAALLWDTGRKTVAADRLRGVQWMMLGALFFFLSMDEALSFHELASGHIADALGTSGALTFAWVIPAGVLCLVGLAALVPFLRQLPARVRNLMLLSAALFLGGAIGMEMVGGAIFGGDDAVLFSQSYRMAVIVEEGLEGLGVLVFIYAILLYRRERRIAALLGG